jgi:hypothetical protein
LNFHFKYQKELGECELLPFFSLFGTNAFFKIVFSVELMLASTKFKGLVEFDCEETKYEKVLLLLKYLNRIFKEKIFFYVYLLVLYFANWPM